MAYVFPVMAESRQRGTGDRMGCSATARGTVWAFRSLLTAMNRSARAPPMLRASLVADTLPVGLDIVAAPNAPDWRWRNGKLWRLGILAITPPREPKHLTGKATSATSDGFHPLSSPPQSALQWQSTQ